jgi:hypothetical protein
MSGAAGVHNVAEWTAMASMVGIADVWSAPHSAVIARLDALQVDHSSARSLIPHRAAWVLLAHAKKPSATAAERVT